MWKSITGTSGASLWLILIFRRLRRNLHKIKTEYLHSSALVWSWAWASNFFFLLSFLIFKESEIEAGAVWNKNVSVKQKTKLWIKESFLKKNKFQPGEIIQNISNYRVSLPPVFMEAHQTEGFVYNKMFSVWKHCWPMFSINSILYVQSSSVHLYTHPWYVECAFMMILSDCDMQHFKFQVISFTPPNIVCQINKNKQLVFRVISRK